MRPPITPFFVLGYMIGQPVGWAFLLSSFFSGCFIFFVFYNNLQIDFVGFSLLGKIIFIFGIIMFVVSCMSLYLGIKKLIRINFLVQNWNATVAIFSHQEIVDNLGKISDSDRRLFFSYAIEGKDYETSFRRIYPYDYDDVIMKSEEISFIIDERDYENQILLYNPKNPNEVVYINEEPSVIKDYLSENQLIKS